MVLLGDADFLEDLSAAGRKVWTGRAQTKRLLEWEELPTICCHLWGWA